MAEQPAKPAPMDAFLESLTPEQTDRLKVELTETQLAALKRVWREIVGAPPEHWAAAPLAPAMQKMSSSARWPSTRLSAEVRLKVIQNEIRHLAEDVGARIGANGIDERSAAAFDAWQEALGKLRQLRESIARAVEADAATRQG